MLTPHLRRFSSATDADSEGGGASGAPRPAAALPEGALASWSEVLDRQALDRLHELDPTGENQLMARVASAFDASVGRLLPQILEAMQTGDLGVIRHVSHTLKSSSASIGAVKLSKMCAEMESMAREGHAEGMTERILLLQREMGVVQAALHCMLDTRTT